MSVKISMKSDTRNKIIETASELFYKKGYNSTGINEIIRESGIAKATLYSHFKAKEDLLVAYLDAKDAELIKNLTTFCDSKTEGNDRLIAVLEFLAAFFNQENFNGCWCIRSVAEVPRENHRVRMKIKQNKEQFRSFLKQLIIQNKPNLTATQQSNLTNRLYLLYEGALTESHIHQADWPIQTAIKLLKEKLEKI